MPTLHEAASPWLTFFQRIKALAETLPPENCTNARQNPAE